MPLDPGRQVTYTVKTGLASRVEPMRITRELPVAGVSGVEVAGPLGASRLAWRDGLLAADATANARFKPPIPLLAPDLKDRTWKGTVEAAGQIQSATATLRNEKDTITLGARKVLTTKSTLALDLPESKGSIELISWFQPGVGLVQQEQRTNGQFVLHLQLLSGP
jgi:hypothetical protein